MVAEALGAVPYVTRSSKGSRNAEIYEQRPRATGAFRTASEEFVVQDSTGLSRLVTLPLHEQHLR